ncbi:prosaposin-like [Seriola lalandi dorsalis]|uniref:prosaposin-like n=1 Tax=Seriola lalandi dorsalis TaxID=1841481 RepID=UPI000C6FA968|nr:prosaposin-like [Seriola lalandi dorsalis]XP_056232843.1 surfactant protein Bb [Seriola aureovittata]
MSASGFVLVLLAASLCPGDSRLIRDPLSFIKQKTLTLDICSECSQIIQLSANMISTRDTKETVYETLHALCLHLPREQASECDSQVKTYLPKVLQQTPGHLKPAETCRVFGLCAVHKEEQLLKLPQHATDEVLSSSALGTFIGPSEQFNPVCTLCLFIMKKLETLLPQNMTEDALMKLMGEVCNLVPKSYKDRCDDFVDKYGVQIVEFLLSSAAPHTICILLHLCLFEEPVPEVLFPSDCESCRTLVVLSRLHLGNNSTEPQTSSFLQSVCVHHPNAIPKCEAFTKIYGSRMQKVLGNQMDVPHACERADLCVALRKLEPLGKNRCTWGPSYWCKDRETAQKCGNQAFCEKYMWKNNE